MRAKAVAAVVHALATAAVVAFQLGLAAGAPLGEYAMGGAFPGRLPPTMRIAAVVQAALLALLGAVVLARAGLLRWPRRTRRLIWLPVVVSALALVLNLATPSARERAIWAPIAFVLLLSSVTVARGRD